MKGLWRYCVLMLAPGFLWGAFFTNGLLRIWDAPGEPLLWLIAAIACAGLLGAWVTHLLRKDSAATPDLSVIDWVTTAALLIVPGVLQRLGIPGYWSGGEELLITTIGAAFALHGWSNLTGAERNWRAIGVLLAAIVFQHFIAINRMHFLEAMFFWSGEILLLAYLWASPATRRGEKKRRWFQRGALLLTILIAPIFRMDYLYATWLERPESMPEEALWNGTDVSAFGSYFGWGVPTDREIDVLFDARNRQVQRYHSDRDQNPAVPGLLGIGRNSAPKILLVADASSLVVDEFAKAMPRGKIALLQFMPWSNSRKGADFPIRSLSAGELSASEKFSILVILGVPEYPAFEGQLLRWLERVTQAVDAQYGVVAVPARLLASPVLMQFFHERFAWHGVLPGPGTTWVFANRPHDLSPAAIDKSLDELFGEESPLPRGAYELLYSNHTYPQSETAAGELRLDSAHWHALRGIAGDGAWGKWLWGGIALLALWRLMRLFAERRGGGYRYWNLMENSFSVAASYLAWMAFLVSDFGAAPAVLFASAPVLAAVFVSRWRNYASWGIFAMASYWCIFRETGLSPNACIVLLLLFFNAWAAGCYAAESLETPERFRNELSAWGIGIAIAAAVIGAAVYAEAPVEAVIGIIVIARLPGLRQIKRFDFKRKS